MTGYGSLRPVGVLSSRLGADVLYDDDRNDHKKNRYLQEEACSPREDVEAVRSKQIPPAVTVAERFV